MTSSLDYAKRYGQIALLYLKYCRGDLASEFARSSALRDRNIDFDATAQQADPEALARDLEEMGPVFIKLGQLLSTRSDIVPEIYLEALSRLQDNVAPVDPNTILALVEDELGGRISKLFADFDVEPLASASLGQVHRATLRNGRAVAVKVQRPGVRSRIAEDLEVIKEIAAFLDQHSETAHRYELLQIAEELEHSLTRETDYLEEARHLSTLRENLREFSNLVVPAPVLDYTTSRILTMELIRGKKLTIVPPVEWTEVPRDELADEVFHAYLKQLVVDGFFHADPHPGNIYLTEDHRIALLDLGMTARVNETLQASLVKLLLAIAEGRGADAAEVATRMSRFPRDGSKRHEFEQRISQLVLENQDSSLERLQMGRVIMTIRRVAAECGVTIDPALNMLGKTMLNLDKVGITLAPHFDPNESIRKHATALLQRRLRKSLETGSLYHSLLETNDLLQRLPTKLNKIVDLVADNELRVRVDTIDEIKLLAGLQKIANRIALGLVLAALIIAAALLIRVPSQYTLWGYPMLAMLFFLGAAGGGIVLISKTLLHDVEDRRRTSRKS